MSGNDSQKKLTARQRRALEALIVGMNQQDAAAAASVAPSTVARWKSEPAFAAELQRQTTAGVNDATRRLAGTLDMAVNTFRRIMESPTANDSLKLRAANYAAAHAVKLLEVSEILQRLEAIEARLG